MTAATGNLYLSVSLKPCAEKRRDHSPAPPEGQEELFKLAAHSFAANLRSLLLKMGSGRPQQSTLEMAELPPLWRVRMGWGNRTKQANSVSWWLVAS
jgi:hypothetical protein